MSVEAPLTVEAMMLLHRTMAGLAEEHPPKVMVFCCPGEQDEFMELLRHDDPFTLKMGAIGSLDGVEFELRAHNFCKPGHVMIIRHPYDYEPFDRVDLDMVGGH